MEDWYFDGLHQKRDYQHFPGCDSFIRHISTSMLDPPSLRASRPQSGWDLIPLPAHGSCAEQKTIHTSGLLGTWNLTSLAQNSVETQICTGSCLQAQPWPPTESLLCLAIKCSVASAGHKGVLPPVGDFVLSLWVCNCSPRSRPAVIEGQRKSNQCKAQSSTELIIGILVWTCLSLNAKSN